MVNIMLITSYLSVLSLAARVQDDNVSIRSGQSSIYITSNLNGQRFGGMISPDDRPGRSK
jgi:hypothetical protein